MGVSGKYVKTFDDGNLAVATGMNLDSDYKHSFFDVQGVENGSVILSSHYDGDTFRLERKKDSHGEYALLTQTSAFLTALGGKAETFKIRPMKGERFY